MQFLILRNNIKIKSKTFLVSSRKKKYREKHYKEISMLLYIGKFHIEFTYYNFGASYDIYYIDLINELKNNG